MLSLKNKSYQNALFISIIYLILGVLWIYLSDYIVDFFAVNKNEITTLQMYKGWFFIFITAVILFLLSYRAFYFMQKQYDEKILQLQRYESAKKDLQVSQSELSKYDALLHTIINSSPDAVFAKDMEGKYILLNRSVSKVVDMSERITIGMDDYAVFKPEIAKKIQETDKKIIFSKEVITFEETTVTKEGKKRIFLVTKGPLFDKTGKSLGMFGISRDITKQKEHEDFLEKSKEKFYKLSYQDSVTLLPNRLHISEILASKCSLNSPFALILLDLDEFKVVNDSYGHRFGDKLLFEVSKVLKDVFGDSAFIARMGGDEFGVVLDTKEKERIEEFMQRLSQKISSPFSIDMINVYMTVSAGISIYPDDASNMDEMYQEADAAMYNAKKRSKNSYSFYNKQFKKDAIEHTWIVTNLKQAIQKDELTLYFQPQNNTYTGEIIGSEALLRWKHDGKMIAPDIFIPLAEKSGLITEIGNFVLKKGFEAAKKWHKNKVAKGRVAVNISARQLTHLDFIKNLKSLLKESGCKPSWIELEITESSVLENPKLVIHLLEQIKALGFYISMDDFGTGYSSLSYLKHLPIDKLKIDRSFIMNIQTQPKNQIIVKTVVFLAKELDIDVLAEGVETQEEHSFLEKNGINAIQGYYYSKPLPCDEFEILLQK